MMLSYCRHSRLSWIYHQKTRNFDRKSSHTNLSKSKQKKNCFQNKKGLQIRTVNPWNNEIVRKHKKDIDKDEVGKSFDLPTSVGNSKEKEKTKKVEEI